MLINSERWGGRGESRTVMEIISRGSELCFSQNYNMVTESIWFFSISVSVTPPAQQLYKSNCLLWKQFFNFFSSAFFLNPLLFAVIGDVRCIVSAAENMHNNNNYCPEGPGERRAPWSLPWEPPHFYPHLWFPRRGVIVPVRKSLPKDCGEEKKKINEGKKTPRSYSTSPCVSLLTYLAWTPPHLSQILHLLPSITLSLVQDSNPIRINIPGEWASFHCSNYKPLET